jgi:hypothetical protein
MDSLNLSRLEQEILKRSQDDGVTIRRIRIIVASALALAITVGALAFIRGLWNVVTWVFIGYLVITTLEKVGYGKAVLGYKSLIRKLAGRVEELERAAAP